MSGSGSEAERLLRFERLLTELSSQLVKSTVEQLDLVIQDAQRLLCEFLGTDRSVIWRPLGQATNALRLAYLYRRTEIPAVPEEMESDVYFPWCQRQLRAGKAVSVSSTRDLPPEAARDSESWRYFGIKSSLNLPVLAGERLVGILSFDTLREERSWPEETVSRLQVLAQTIAHALVRKESEEALRDSERRWRSLVETTPDFIALYDRDGRFVYLNRYAEGFSPPDVMGRPGEEFISPGSRETFRHRFAECLQTGGVVTFEHGGPDGNSAWPWYETSFVPILREGTIAQVMGIARDVSERKRAEEELRESEERHRHLVHHLHAGVVVHGADTSVTLANRHASTLLGLSLDQMTGKLANDPVWSFVREDGTPMPVDEYPVNRVLASRKPLRDMVAGVNHPGAGDRVWLLINAFPELGPQKEVRQVVVTFIDITERKRAEEERQQLQANLAQSDRLASMGMLAAGVAHEINNPLTYVLFNLESICEHLAQHMQQLANARQLLVSRLGDEGLRETLNENFQALDTGGWAEAADRLKDALLGTQEIKDITRGLRTFSRVEKDQVVPVDLADSIESAVSISFNEIKYRARVVKEIGSTARVLGSEGRLSQVFLNLLVNAAHAITEGNVENNLIRLRTWQEGSTVFAEVQDTGCGIPPEDLVRIFDPFFTTKPVGIGSGLGLSIVKDIVTGYGGAIDVTSEVGKGTRFLIRFPAAANEQVTKAAEGGTAQEASPVRGRVLLIDDEAGVRSALKRILKSHEVAEAESGEHACELLSKDQTFDVILCDMMMPKMSGMDVHRWLIEHYPRLARRVVFMTGGAFTPTARHYLDTVDNLRLEKPFDTRNLRMIVEERVLASKARD